MSYLRPYFMENEEWYTYDKKTNKYTLTDKAPKEARKSYEDFIEYTEHPFFYGMSEEDIDKFVEHELEITNKK